MKRRLLLLVTTRTYRAGAFIAASRALDLDLTVGSERAQILAGSHPEGHLLLDPRYPGAAVEQVTEFARAHPIHAVIGADDESAPLAARVAERLGLPGHPAAAVAASRDKFTARERLAAAGLPTPPFALLPCAGGELPVAFPCVLKPRGLAASRGVIRADDPAGFAAARERIASLLDREGPAGPDEPPRDTILVEGFLPGREVALEGLMAEGELEVLALFDKPDPLDGPYFEETIYVTPSRLPEPVQRRIADAARAAAVALGLGNGPIHAEFRIGPGPAGIGGAGRVGATLPAIDAETVWPIEIAPRSIGGLCSRAVRFEGGESLESVLLRRALGEIGTPRPSRRASGVMMIPIPGPGRLRQIRGADEAREVAGVESVMMTTPIGSQLVPLPEGSQYLGFIFAEADSPDEVERILRGAHGRMQFDIDPPVPAGEERRET